MNNLKIGKGKIAGKAVYADRDFKKGELVMAWNLKQLTQPQFNALPKSEHMFVHSFWGKMWLFPEPSRYTNHSANPTVVSDFEKMCDYAARDIKKGEMITVNATDEIRYELKTFLEAYEKATNSRDFNNVEPFVAKSAVFKFTNGTFEGIDAIRRAFEETYEKIQDETYSISNIEWTKTGYRNAECTYKFKSDGIVKSRRQVYEGRGASTFKRIDGNWRIAHEELVKSK